jgi:hypothetical protein
MRTNNRLIGAILGFLLFFSGFLSFILALVGLNWKPLSFIYYFGNTATVLIQILIVITGIILMYYAFSSEQDTE